MNIGITLPLAALVLMAIATATINSANDSTYVPASGRIIELPAITVNPSPRDAAYFRAHRIVDLPRITVRPESADLALFLADNTARIAHLRVSLQQTPVTSRQLATASSYALAAR